MMRIRSKKAERGLLRLGLVLIVLSFSLVFVRCVHAEKKIFNYNKNISYDIYIGSSNESTSIIKNIEILRIDEIGDEMFLVVQVKGFQLNSAEGYIRLSAVQAILPSNYIKVNSL